uniref:Cytoplasmic protein n=1 Tax=Globodera pallida TaxID=36090 RepID=A0A183CGQ6_GLOPA
MSSFSYLVKRIRQTPVSASIKQLVIPKDYKIYKISAAVQKPFLLVDSGIYNESGRERQQSSEIRLRHDSDFIRILSMNILWDNAG